MSVPVLRLVFQGKIAPDQDLAEVKARLQKLFKKDAATIDRMFGGKKVCLKQGLTQAQAEQYQQKMRSIGVLCDIEEPKTQQTRQSPVTPSTVTQTPISQSPAKKSAAPATPTQQSASSRAPSNTEPLDDKPLKLADIDKAFVGSIPKVELPASYKAGIVAVGITMVLLPILYIGLIALLGYGVLSHSLANTSWMQSLGYKLGLVAYATPIVVGITVILFMVKPLFARAAKVPKTLVLDPLKEPIFFHFVNKIALAVGAPRPKQIEVDCQVNASASFRKGLFSFLGDDLVLTIGMPLLAGFNTRQLAGVLAHEFGHFSQGAGMRFHYLTHKVNNWFFNAVYLRDSWDEKLEQAAEDSDGWISVILNFARGGVWVTRKVLYAFMMAGHAVSSYMLRQMEFDADRYEAHMAGSEQFKDTTLQLQRLGVAFQVSHDQLAQAWEDKKLVDNLPRLIAHNAEQLPDELDRALLIQMQETRTQVYDSHPSDNQRIDNAMAQNAKGLFELGKGIKSIFKSFDAMAKQVSFNYYAHELGLEVDRNKLIDINQVVKITEENEKQQEAYHEYFKDMAPVFEFPISVNIFDASSTDWDGLLNQYQAVNEEIVDQIADRRKKMLQANSSFEMYQVLTMVHLLRESGFILFPQWFDMDEQTFAKCKENLPKVEQSWQLTMQQLTSMFEPNDRRLSIALTLLNHPRLIERNPNHTEHLKARNRLSLLINNVKSNAGHITDFELKHFKLASLLSCAPLMGQKPEELPSMTQNLLEELKQSYNQLIDALGRLDYPFVAEDEQLTVADYIADFLPPQKHSANEAQYYVKCGEVLLEKVNAIYARILSGLANIALNIDRLIPNMNEEVQESEQTQQEDVLAFNSDVQSNNANQQDDSTRLGAETTSTSNKFAADSLPSTTPELTASEEDLLEAQADQLVSTANVDATESSNSTNNPVAKAHFSIDEPVEKSEPEIEAQEATQSSETDAVLSQGDSSVLQDQKRDGTIVDTTGCTADGTDNRATGSSSLVTGKAVFAIDETSIQEQELEEESAAVPESKYSGKAVFSIDESSGDSSDASAADTQHENELEGNTVLSDTNAVDKVSEVKGVEKNLAPDHEHQSPSLGHNENEVSISLNGSQEDDSNKVETPVEISHEASEPLELNIAATTPDNSLVTESKAQVLSLEPMESKSSSSDTTESQNQSREQEHKVVDKPSGLTLELEPIAPTASTDEDQPITDDDEEKAQSNQNPPKAAQS